MRFGELNVGPQPLDRIRCAVLRLLAHRVLLVLRIAAQCLSKGLELLLLLRRDFQLVVQICDLLVDLLAAARITPPLATIRASAAAAAVEKQRDGVAGPGLELGGGERRAEAEGAALRPRHDHQDELRGGKARLDLAELAARDPAFEMARDA